MALNIRNQETETLATELAKLTGETKTDAVTKALRDRLERVRRERSSNSAGEFDPLMALVKHWASLPVLDDRTPEEMLYDEHGLPR